MLYPTYLSSFTHLLQADIRPISLLSVLRGNSSRSFFSTKPVIEPPPTNSMKSAKLVKPAKSSNAAKSVPAQQSATARATAHPATSPISISDRHSRTGTATG